MYLILLVIGYVDMKEKRIPNELSLLLLFLLLLKRPQGLIKGLGVFLVLNLLYYLVYLLSSKEVMGYGDVKLFSVLATGLEKNLLAFIMLSFILAGLVALTFFIRGERKRDLALAPFIIMSFLYFK